MFAAIFNKLINMKKTLLLLLLPLLVTTSCETNDDEVLGNQSTVRVKSIIHQDRESVISYGANGYSTGSFEKTGDTEYETELEYDQNNNVTSVSQYTNLILWYRGKYTYADNLIVKEENYRIQPFGSDIKERVFIYDADKNLVKILLKDYDGRSYEETITYENGNCSSITSKVVGSSDGSYRKTFRYDDKNNYKRTMYPDNYLKILFEGKNNLLQEGNSSEMIYEYNSDNYPIKITENNYITLISYFS